MHRVTPMQEQGIQLRLSGLKPGYINPSRTKRMSRIVNKATATRANQQPEESKELIVCFLGGPSSPPTPAAIAGNIN